MIENFRLAEEVRLKVHILPNLYILMVLDIMLGTRKNALRLLMFI